jgi:hypothetical protein
MEGRILGNRYELLEKIGGGGMAIVYKAKCNLLNRFVAVKVLRSEFINDEEFVKRFRIEAQSAASLSHPNIVSIYDVGHEESIHYIVMEFVNGITLKDYIMCNAFVGGLKEAGYKQSEITVEDTTVKLKFDKPRTPQPITRNKETDRIIQIKNKLMCDAYKEITGPYDNFTDKMNALNVQAPELYEKIISMGKAKKIFEAYENIKDHIQ